MGSPELRAALERGRRAVLVRPPAVEHAADVWEVLPQRVLIVCPDRATAVVLADRWKSPVFASRPSILTTRRYGPGVFVSWNMPAKTPSPR